jgi:hypothetical protein
VRGRPVTEEPAVGKTFRISRDERPPIDFEIVLEDQVLTPAVGEPGSDEFRPETRGEVTEKFRAIAAVPGALMLDVAASGAAGAEFQASALRRFLSRVIVPEDRVRLNQVLDESTPVIDLPTLNAITEYLMGEYAARPTK